MNRLLTLLLCSAMLLLGTSCANLNLRAPDAPEASAQWYLATMYQKLALTRKQMPVIEIAGQAAARRVVNGGMIWVGGSQTDFISEAVGRAGGLMGIKQLNMDQVFRRDAVLYAARGSLSANDLSIIARCKQAGAYVIAFAACGTTERTPDGPDLLINSGDLAGLPAGRGICPLDTVTNVVNLWAFTGEFTAACTRLGKMPVLYESYGLPGGRDRGAKYAGQMFHTDMTIQPIQSGVLGNAYLDQILKMINRVERDDIEEISQAGRWIVNERTSDCGVQFEGHMAPDHFRDPRAAQPFRVYATVSDPTPKTNLLIHISYQRPPQDLINAARRARTRLLYCSVLRGEGGLSEFSIYANPHWPMEDACVVVPGYDIPILPASGVMQACLYWSIVAEAHR